MFSFSKNKGIERFSYDLEMKTREQNRNNKRTEIEQYDWSVERIQTLVAFDWFSERSGEKNCHARELSRNQSTLCFDVMLQHHWQIEGCPLHISVFFGGKTKSPYFDLFIHWLIKQIMNTHRNHFSRSYENRSIVCTTTKCVGQLREHLRRCWSGFSPVGEGVIVKDCKQHLTIHLIF